MRSTMANWSIFVMSIILTLEILNKLLYRRLPRRIDLNRIEYYLVKFTNITQVISLELYYVTPKIKILHVGLKVAIEDIEAGECLRKQIKSDLWQKFGVTETLIDMTEFILGKPYNLDSIQLEFQTQLNFKRQASIDRN